MLPRKKYVKFFLQFMNYDELKPSSKQTKLNKKFHQVLEIKIRNFSDSLLETFITPYFFVRSFNTLPFNPVKKYLSY